VLDTEKFGNCSRDKNYGYDKSSPCIFLKLNRIFDWVPEYYNDTADLPEEMPEALKLHIGSLDVASRNQVWITCRGEDGSDKEIIGPIEYYPTQGFPSYYYPYTNLPGYVSPLIAVQFLRPKCEHFVMVKMWGLKFIF
jgi:sodium/potassium-transporting ATPase subunit beta